jgi:hypothetical protein
MLINKRSLVICMITCFLVLVVCAYFIFSHAFNTKLGGRSVKVFFQESLF